MIFDAAYNGSITALQQLYTSGLDVTGDLVSMRVI